ncbi:MAG: ABC transporter permease, partial [Thermoprotei archaeon]
TSLFGAIISEQVFQWPGMGRLYYTALYNGDTKIVIADTFMFVLLFVVVKFILDATYGLLDPRIKASR